MNIYCGRANEYLFQEYEQQYLKLILTNHMLGGGWKRSRIFWKRQVSFYAWLWLWPNPPFNSRLHSLLHVISIQWEVVEACFSALCLKPAASPLSTTWQGVPPEHLRLGCAGVSRLWHSYRNACGGAALAALTACTGYCKFITATGSQKWPHPKELSL